MADKRRLNLSFSMASPLQREAWERLRAIPAGQRTNAVCRAVCRMYELEAIRQIIREELDRSNFTTEQCVQPQEAGDVGSDVLGFLSALQQEGDDID